MKKIYLLPTLFLAALQILVAAPMQNINKNSELNWVNQQVQAILPPRQGISISYINTLKEPFDFTYVERTKTGKKVIFTDHKHLYKQFYPLHVTLIINSKALINGKWYALNQKIRGYKIIAINNLGVKLKKKNLIKTLLIRQKNNNIKIHIK
jgi:hypothetical protein